MNSSLSHFSPNFHRSKSEQQQESAARKPATLGRTRKKGERVLERHSCRFNASFALGIDLLRVSRVRWETSETEQGNGRQLPVWLAANRSK